MKAGKDWLVDGEAIVKSLAGSASRLLLASDAGKLTALAGGTNGQWCRLVAGIPAWATLNAVDLPSHGHAIGEIAGLQTALDGKAPVSHNQAISTITGLQTALDGKSNTGHGHAIGEITGLQTALDGKAPVSHNQAISTITGLQTALDGKSNTGHGHAISEIANLQGALDGKSNVGHSHTISAISGLQGELDGKAPVSHNQAISTITGLQTALDGKSNTGHGHQMSEIANLQDELGDIWDAILALQGGGSGDGGILSISMPGEFTVTIANRVATITWNNVQRHFFLAGPSSDGPSDPTAAPPTFRPIYPSDY